MSSNAVNLIDRGNRRFAARIQLDQLRQEIALNFQPWDASFTEPLILGEDFAGHLVDGVPLLLARDYINQIGSMLRPPGKQWFHRRTSSEDMNNDREIREYLDWRSMQTMRIIFDRGTGSLRAFSKSDRMFGTYGDAVMAIDTNDEFNALRLHGYHVGMCAWSIGKDDRADVLTRKEMLSARVIKQRFGNTGVNGNKGLHRKIEEACEKDPDREFEIRHEVMPADEYDTMKSHGGYFRRKAGQGWASVWLDVENKHIMRETMTPTMRYVVPRSVTLEHSAYGMSMATTIALPDARLIQQQALAILEAAERQIDPPMAAYDGDTIRGDLSLARGHINWVDRDYDEKSGAPIQPLELGKNFQLGVESLMRTESSLTRAFHLDVLRMPDTRRSKSTEEVQFLIDEYVRAALPLFAPMQAEYNEAVLNEVDAVVQSVGMFPPHEMPDALRRNIDDVQYAWDNPLAEMIERQKAATVGEISGLAQTVAALEEAAKAAPSIQQADTGKMFRESMIGLGGARYLLPEERAAAERQALEQANAEAAQMAAAPNMARLVDSGVNAAQVSAEMAQTDLGIPLLPAPA